MRALWKVALAVLTALVLCAVAIGPYVVRGAAPDGAIEQYLAVWKAVSRIALFALVALWAFSLLVNRLCDYRFFKRHIGGATPGTLGAIRMLVCTVLLVSVLWEDLASSALLPREMFQSESLGLVGLLSAIPVFQSFVSSYEALWVFERLLVIALFMGAIGLRTNWVLPAAAIGYLTLGGILRGYSWFYHTGLIPLWALIVLCFTPCGHGWSVDRLLRIWRGRPVPPADREAPIYGWGRFAVWTAVALPYLAAGLSKLRLGGLTWWEADNMKRFMLTDNLQPMQWDWDGALALMNAPEFIFAVLGLAGLAAELLFVSVLFSRRARRVLPLAIVGLHSGIFFVQNILFFDLILMQAVFFDFRALRKRIGARLAATRGRVIVLYDSARSRSQRARLMLCSLDLFERIRFVDVRETDPAAQGRDRALRLERPDADLWRALTRELPALWPLAPLFYVLPGMETLLARLAGSTRRREVAVAIRPAPVGPVAVRRCVTRGAVLVLAVTLMMGGAWVGNFKWYPFSPFPMYANNQPVDQLVHVKAWVHYEDGRVEQACFDRWIGATADSRYRQVLRMAFIDLEGRKVCRDFLDACARQANSELGEGERVERFEIQLWAWAYKAQPQSPTHGDIAALFTHAVPVETLGGAMADAGPAPARAVLR